MSRGRGAPRRSRGPRAERWGGPGPPCSRPPRRQTQRVGSGTPRSEPRGPGEGAGRRRRQLLGRFVFCPPRPGHRSFKVDFYSKKTKQNKNRKATKSKHTSLAGQSSSPCDAAGDPALLALDSGKEWKDPGAWGRCHASSRVLLGARRPSAFLASQPGAARGDSTSTPSTRDALTFGSCPLAFCTRGRRPLPAPAPGTPGRRAPRRRRRQLLGRPPRAPSRPRGVGPPTPRPPGRAARSGRATASPGRLSPSGPLQEGSGTSGRPALGARRLPRRSAPARPPGAAARARRARALPGAGWDLTGSDANEEGVRTAE